MDEEDINIGPLGKDERVTQDAWSNFKETPVEKTEPSAHDIKIAPRRLSGRPSDSPEFSVSIPERRCLTLSAFP